jgi:hypothetical protein
MVITNSSYIEKIDGFNLNIVGLVSMSKLNAPGAQNDPSNEIPTFTGPEFNIGTGHMMCFPVNHRVPEVVKQRASLGLRQVPNLHIAEPLTTTPVVDPRMVTNDAPFPRTLVGSILSGTYGMGS